MREESARELAKRFGGVNKIPMPLKEDLYQTGYSAICALFAKAWSQRVEEDIKSGRLQATQPEVSEFLHALNNFEEVRIEFREKRRTKSLKANFEQSYAKLYQSAESLKIRMTISKSDDL